MGKMSFHGPYFLPVFVVIIPSFRMPSNERLRQKANSLFHKHRKNSDT